MKKQVAINEDAYKLFYRTLGLMMAEKQGFTNPSEAIILLCNLWQSTHKP
jgi:hypothetical protein